MTYHGNHVENALAELQALLQIEEYDGYGKMRTRPSQTICKWWYQFADHYSFDREVVFIAQNYFSRYILTLQGLGPLTQEILQKAAITAMFIAVKAHAMRDEDIDETRIRALSRLAYGNFDAREIFDVEKDMLQVLNWRINPPTMHQFASKFTMIHPLGMRDVDIFEYLNDMTRYQMELAIFYPELMMNYKLSVLVYAGMLRAEEEINYSLLTEEMREDFFSLHDTMNLDPCQVEEARSALENLIPKIPSVEQFERLRLGEALPEHTVRDVSTTPTCVAGM